MFDHLFLTVILNYFNNRANLKPFIMSWQVLPHPSVMELLCLCTRGDGGVLHTSQKFTYLPHHKRFPQSGFYLMRDGWSFPQLAENLLISHLELDKSP